MIHKTAIISKNANIYDNVSIGAYSSIGQHVTIKSGSVIHSNVIIEGETVINEDCEIFPFTTIGSRAQDTSIHKDLFGKFRMGKIKILIYFFS